MAKFVKVSVGTNKVGSDVTDILEFDDDVTDEDIDKQCQDWMWNYIEFWYEVQE